MKPDLHTVAFTEYTHAALPDAAEEAFNQTRELRTEEMVLNLGPQHPSTHGVLRLEVLTDGEVVVDVVPHLGYMHRCFEKHAENLTYEQAIPFVDRLDYLASMTNAHIWAMGVERMLGIEADLHPRVEYIRVLVSELNRIASHLLAIGTFGLDVGAITAFLWTMRDREHILNLLEWVAGARMLYNYIWIGGLYYDLPLGFEERCTEFADYFEPKLEELDILLTTNPLFVARTANIGVLPLATAIDYGVTGPNLRASGLRYDLRRLDAYGVYDELEFEVPIGSGQMGAVGDVWDRYWVRAQEMRQSLGLVRQCLKRLRTDLARTPSFDPRAACPGKSRPKVDEFYFRGEGAKGLLAFYWIAEPKRDIPFRCKCRGPSFSNLSVLPQLARGVLVADLVAILGSLDIVLCEIDR